jgi:hypothetical protein
MRILSLLIAADAPETDMACRGVDRFEMARSRTMGRQQLNTQKCEMPL